MVDIKINKEDLRTGDILLVSSKSWIARQIQFFQKNKWNHAGIVVEIWGEWYICESDKRGICLTKLSDYINSNKELMICRPTWSYDEKNLSKFMMPYCGHVKYDYTSLLFYQLIYQVTGKWMGKKEDKATNAFYCSEWAAFVHHTFDEGVFPHWYETSPKDIFENNLLLHLTLK